MGMYFFFTGQHTLLFWFLISVNKCVGACSLAGFSDNYRESTLQQNVMRILGVVSITEV